MMLFNYIVLIVISLAVAYFAIGESATINSKNESVNGVELTNKTSEQNDSSELRICSFDTPCGWYIYKKDELNGFERTFSSFLLNTCKCKDETYRCIRIWEKLSAQAYVYHCRQNSTKLDKLAPDHDIYSRNDDPYVLLGFTVDN
ncbi:GSCOCG00004211001-RA-CDS [Cotesia congregata]|nr:GSCOCG00004211001-RA-CDS [Cotesia congregata]